MKVNRIITGIIMVLRMLFRRRIVIVLLVVIPAVFLTIVELTTSERMLPFLLASFEDDVFVEISEKGISFVFFSISSAGFLVAFLALNLIQKNKSANQRLVVCGYHPFDILASTLATIILLILFVSFYVGVLTNAFYPINNFPAFIVSLYLIGFVYGCYGLLIGSLIKGELEGILFVVLLVNIDVGWLQNPLFYAEAHNKLFIHYLPGYFPSQSGIITAFTTHSPLIASIKSFLYGTALLIIAMFLFYKKMKLKK